MADCIKFPHFIKIILKISTLAAMLDVFPAWPRDRQATWVRIHSMRGGCDMACRLLRVTSGFCKSSIHLITTGKNYAARRFVG
jgi:hypothetical protein